MINSKKMKSRIFKLVNIINIFVKSSSIQLIASCAGVLLWTAYIVVDVQMIVGGSHHKYQFEEDEHVFATINLYLDIINLFIKNIFSLCLMCVKIYSKLKSSKQVVDCD